MDTKKERIKELRSIGVLNQNQLSEMVKNYEPLSNKLNDAELMAYFVSRAKIEVLSKVYANSNSQEELSTLVKSEIKNDLELINQIKHKMES